MRTFPSSKRYATGWEFPCVPFLRSGNIDREYGLVYLDEASESDFDGIGNLEGKAGLPACEMVCEVMQPEVLDCGYIDACAVCQPPLQ